MNALSEITGQATSYNPRYWNVCNRTCIHNCIYAVIFYPTWKQCISFNEFTNLYIRGGFLFHIFMYEVFIISDKQWNSIKKKKHKSISRCPNDNKHLKAYSPHHEKSHTKNPQQAIKKSYYQLFLSLTFNVVNRLQLTRNPLLVEC